MAARNDITGAAIQTKSASKAYRDNWEAIFAKKKEVNEEVLDTYNDERLVSKFDKQNSNTLDNDNK